MNDIPSLRKLDVRGSRVARETFEAFYSKAKCDPHREYSLVIAPHHSRMWQQPQPLSNLTIRIE